MEFSENRRIGDIDQKKAWEEELRRRQKEEQDLAREPLGTVVYRSGDTLPGSRKEKKSSQPLDEKIDPNELLTRTLRKPEEFDQFFAFATEFAREQKDDALLERIRKTPRARLDIEALQKELRRRIEQSKERGA